MKIEKWVKKHTRIIFGIIIVMMILSLVVWGYMGTPTSEEAKKTAGTIDGEKITYKEFFYYKQLLPSILRLSLALDGRFVVERGQIVPLSWLMDLYNEEQSRIQDEKFNKLFEKYKNQKDDEAARKDAQAESATFAKEEIEYLFTWWIMAVSRYSKKLGFLVSIEDLQDAIKNILQRARVPDLETYLTVFPINYEDFVFSLRTYLLIKKLMQIYADSQICTYKDVIKTQMQNIKKKAKFSYAKLDGRKYNREILNIAKNSVKELRMMYNEIKQTDEFIKNGLKLIKERPHEIGLRDLELLRELVKNKLSGELASKEISKLDVQHQRLLIELLQQKLPGKIKLREPRKIKIEAIYLPFEAVKRFIPVPSEQEIKNYYEANKEKEFSYPADPNNPEAGKRYTPYEYAKNEIIDKLKLKTASAHTFREATKIRQQILKRGADVSFEQITREFPTPFFKIKYLSKTIKPATISEFEDEVGTNTNLDNDFASLKAGDISKVIQTSSASLIYKVIEVIPEQELKYTDMVRKTIEKGVQKKLLTDKLFKEANELCNEIHKKGFYNFLVSQPQLKFKHTLYVDTESQFGGMEGQTCRRLVNKAFELSPGRSAAVKDETDVYLIYVEDIAEEHPSYALKDIEQERQEKIKQETTQDYKKIFRWQLDNIKIVDMIERHRE